MNFVSIRRVMDMPAQAHLFHGILFSGRRLGEPSHSLSRFAGRNPINRIRSRDFSNQKQRCLPAPPLRRAWRSSPLAMPAPGSSPSERNKRSLLLAGTFCFAGGRAGAVSRKRPKPCIPDEKNSARVGGVSLSKKSFAPQRALNRISPLAAKSIKTRDMCVGFYTNRRQVRP